MCQVHTQAEDTLKAEGLEYVWELITKDPEWAVTLRKRKIV